MKKFILALLIAAPVLASAQIFGRTIYNCTYWSYKDGAYVCSGYPQREQLADANDVNFTVRQLESRIAALEQQVLQLQQQQQQAAKTK